jgi:hypothetical protein
MPGTTYDRDPEQEGALVVWVDVEWEWVCRGRGLGEG